MSEVFAKDFKILTLGLADLSTDPLGEVVVHCPDNNDLQKALEEYRSSTIFIACGSDKLIGLDMLLENYLIDALYVINNEQDQDIREWLDGLIYNNIIEVQNKKNLMRRLCTTAMLSYHKQGMEYRNNGNNGLANRCILDALKALDYSTKFI